MDNRLKRLEVTIDDDDSDQELPHKQEKKVAVLNVKGADKFVGGAVTRGLFFNAQEDIDYKFVPILPVMRQQKAVKKENKGRKKQEQMKEQKIQTKHDRPCIKMINEFSHENQQHLPERNQNQPEREELTQNQICIPTVFSNRLLNIAFSDEEEEEQPNSQQQEERSNDPSSKAEEEVLSGRDQVPSDREEVIPQMFSKQIEKLDEKQLLYQVKDIQSFSRVFSQQPIPSNKLIQLLMYRDTSGFNAIWPAYKVLFPETSFQILAAKKMMGSTTANYYITVQEGVEKVDHINFVAKMRSNFTGSIFNVFDNGISPEKGSSSNKFKFREIRATIKFKCQLLSMEPRQFEVFFLKEGVSYFDLNGLSPRKQTSLDVLYEDEKNVDKIYHFKNRKPIYSLTLKGYILNFGGRVQLPSIKNFIMEDNGRRQVLMLGKTAQDIFRIDVSHPMPPYIGLCVCLANFDSKFLSD